MINHIYDYLYPHFTNDKSQTTFTFTNLIYKLKGYGR